MALPLLLPLAFSAANFSGTRHCKLLRTDQLCENRGGKNTVS